MSTAFAYWSSQVELNGFFFFQGQNAPFGGFVIEAVVQPAPPPPPTHLLDQVPVPQRQAMLAARSSKLRRWLRQLLAGAHPHRRETQAQPPHLPQDRSMGPWWHRLRHLLELSHGSTSPSV